ncbi:hypothetical protein U1701_16110 [Sphingomonas sp. PB2P19]|uniref:hypothetical protein n=1 Tax=Sphingomonas rhamnosi TaxID=3096156 RepID=UPI002FCB7782
MAKDTDAKLPDSELKKIQSIVLDHVQSLNRAGSVGGADPVSKEAALAALGFEGTSDAPDQWLCGADNVCGAKA